MSTRREALQHSVTVAALLASGGFITLPARAAWPQTAFDAKTLADAVKALGGGAPSASTDVSIVGPDIAENGAVVPVGVASSAAGVKRLLLLVEKNPSALAASFTVLEGAEANVSTRVKMGQSSNVYGVAMLADGRVLYAQKEIKVTLGGCGG